MSRVPTAAVLVAFAVDTVRNAPWTFVAIIAIGVAAVVLDALNRRHRGSAGGTGRAGGRTAGNDTRPAMGRTPP